MTKIWTKTLMFQYCLLCHFEIQRHFCYWILYDNFQKINKKFISLKKNSAVITYCTRACYTRSMCKWSRKNPWFYILSLNGEQEFTLSRTPQKIIIYLKNALNKSCSELNFLNNFMFNWKLTLFRESRTPNGT